MNQPNRPTIREAARNRTPLGGPDAQALEGALQQVERERDQARAVLDAINGIRNSIIGTQSVNWSEHIYPLVAALDGAGLPGASYPEARENLGTLIERMAKLEATNEQLRQWIAQHQEESVAVQRALKDATDATGTTSMHGQGRELLAARRIAALEADVSAAHERWTTGRDAALARVRELEAERDAAIARVAELEALVAEMQKPDPLQEKIDALTRRVLDAAQPKPRDESVPPPGWLIEDVCQEWMAVHNICADGPYESAEEALAVAWRIYDAEHGYAPPPKPRGRWPKDRDPIARMHEILQGSDMSLDDEGPGLLACIDKIQDDRDAIRADERRRTQRDIAHHMRCTSGRWGDVINDIEAGTYERVDAAAELEEPSR